MFLIILGLSIALLSFFFSLYNMYRAFNNHDSISFDAPVNTFRRHIVAVAGIVSGGAIFVTGVIVWLIKAFG